MSVSELMGREDLLRHRSLQRPLGLVEEVVGLVIRGRGPQAELGSLCQIERQSGPPLLAEVVGFADRHTLLMPLGSTEGLRPGQRIRPSGNLLGCSVGPGLLGCVVDALGRPLDGSLLQNCPLTMPLRGSAPPALDRERITEQIGLGVRAVDALLPCGRGQRLGLFAGSGVGKSSLLSMIARASEADVNVIGLVGERGREVREFLERDLGPEGLARSVVVVSTSDQPALLRLKAALTATAIAEYFRDQGKNVLLLVDSLTRIAHAQREIGLAVGEPPSTRGYTPSVFALLPALLERAGTAATGSITGIYSVLVEGDDFNEPLIDTVRATLDGHVALSRELAQAGHYPAIDVLGSISRLESEVSPAEVRAAALTIRRGLSLYRDNADFLAIGAYRDGSNPELDRFLAVKSHVDAFLHQSLEERSTVSEAREQLLALAALLS